MSSSISRVTRAGQRAARLGTGEEMIPSVWRGRAMEVTARGLFITIPRLTGDARHGPVDTLTGVEVAEGDSLLVVMVEGRKDSPVVVGSITHTG